MRAQGLSASYVYATYRRLAQIMGEAVHDGLIPRSPCSRRTSPGQASQRPHVATTEQLWALHDAMPTHLRPAVLLGAFVGLRTAEAVALRVTDVDVMRGVVSPEIQYPSEPLKTDTSRTPVPIPKRTRARAGGGGAALGRNDDRHNEIGRPTSPWAIERAIRTARKRVDGLPSGFRFHDLRPYLASLLIASGADVKVVHRRLRHASATTTLNTYAHLWPDADEAARAAVAGVLAARAALLDPNLADYLRTRDAGGTQNSKSTVI